jgi:hypothetical protein
MSKFTTNQKKLKKDYDNKQNKINELVLKFNKISNESKFDKWTLERSLENWQRLADLNYELAKLGNSPIYIANQDLTSVILMAIRELKELKSLK